MNKEKRFETIYKENGGLSNVGNRYILMDKETGVQYLVLNSGYGLTMTPLLDSYGKPVVGAKNFPGD